MYKMLIVEDERWEREGLLDFLDWASMGIAVIETAADGIEGLDKALEFRPDIIITDIQMPGRNGIEMAKLVLDQLPEVRIVVLTGYDDFGYARDALRFGAVDYVLKPVGEEELLSTMEKVVRGCEENRLKRSEEERLWLEKDAVHHLALRQRLMDLLLSRAEEAARQQTISELQAGGYLEGELCSIWICAQPAALQLPEAEQLEQLAGRMLGRKVLVHPAGQGILGACFILLIALRADEAGLQPQLAFQLLQELELLQEGGGPAPLDGSQREDARQERDGWMVQTGPAAWIIGTGRPAAPAAAAGESFREAQNAFQYALFNGLSGVLAAEEEQLARQQFTRDADPFSVQFRELAKRLRHDLGSGSPAEPVLDGLFALLAGHPGAGRSYIASQLGGVIESCSALAMPAAQATTAFAAGHMEALLSCRTLTEMRDYTAAVVDDMARLLEEKRGRKDDYLINRVIQLIEEQYGNQELSLAYLAGEVFVSPNHLGMIFKKKTGKTPSEYIQEFRLQRAEEMLRTGKQRIAVVAELIGIPNPSYFGLLYKQVYGMTPGEYREFVQR
ncbi:response regulator [Paenibacillus sp. MMS20-IR301]|uniref:response regulator n=1 Tax=Paenibacillus sp. MMS20-IR301 TaxID=2895946 RepID=UPI0028EFC651|nr:response regulator [Paenibacillus sp. MMS20-IR301]WNS46406.1 response regulator [Paenibacillus sp. MMS20-IR301]